MTTNNAINTQVVPLQVVVTDNSTATELYSWSLDEGDSVTITGIVKGASTNSDALYWAEFTASARREEGEDVELVGTPIISWDSDFSTDPSIEFSADTAEQKLVLEVTGLASQSITWTYQSLTQSTVNQEIIVEQNQAPASLVGYDNSESQFEGENVQAVLEEIPFVHVRQTVLSGPVDSDGRADFLSAGTGLEVISSTSDPLICAFGAGFGVQGQKNFVSEISSQLTWSDLPASDDVYLYIDLDSSSGAITTGSTTVSPVYAYARPSSPSSGQFFYPLDHRSRPEVYDGSSWVPTLRLFVGQCATGSTSVSSVISYAYQGRYLDDNNSTISNSSAYTFSHNIGAPVNYQTKCKMQNSALGYSVGTIIDRRCNDYIGSAGSVCSGFVEVEQDRNILRVATGNDEAPFHIQYNGGNSTSINCSDISLYVECWRSF